MVALRLVRPPVRPSCEFSVPHGGVSGAVIVTCVPAPSGELTSSRPPMDSTRCAIPVRPVAFSRSGSAPPRPSSVMTALSPALVQRSATVAREARACLEAFVSASATAK